MARRRRSGGRLRRQATRLTEQLEAGQQTWVAPKKARIHGRKLPGDRGTKFAPYHVRLTIYNRDAGQCQYCGVEVSLPACNIDHVFPYHRGGPTRKDNLVVACRGCNKLKGGDVIPEGFGPRDSMAHWERDRASRRMKDTMSVIRMASASGIYLDDLFSEATQEEWGRPVSVSPPW